MNILCKIMLAMLAGWILAGTVRGAAENDDVTVDAETAGVIKGALKYLANQQSANGSWELRKGRGGYPVAMTGYALLAMMSAGNLPDEGEYRTNVTAGEQYLWDQVQPDGIFQDVDKGKYMYSHGIATMTLAELTGEAKSAAARPRLEQLVGTIVSGQSQLGGWRYVPGARDADISATVPQVAALRAAKGAGLAVPQGTVDQAVAYIRECFEENTGGFAYQPKQGAGFARTAAAVYSLQVCGEYDDPRISRGSAYLFEHGQEEQKWWPYGSYYAAPAQYMIGGDVWKSWYAQVKAKLLSTVVRDGDAAYWDDKRSMGLGPVYSTAVYVTILAMPYHYLPLYQR